MACRLKILGRSAALVALSVTLVACVAGPDYQPAPPATPAAFSRTGQPASTGELATWWRTFDDPLLDSLVARALTGDLDVQRAALRIEQARQQARIAGTAGRPSLSAQAGASVTRLSENSSLGAIAARAGANPGGGGGLNSAGLPGTTIETYQFGFDAAWELDLFGGVKRTTEAAEARISSAVWSRRDAELMLAAEVARSYLQHRALDRRLGLLDERLTLDAEAIDYRGVRQRNGLAASPELRQAEAALAIDQAAQTALLAERDAQAHALAVLLGQPPLALAAELAAATRTAATPADPPVGLPSDLLRRRPDIRAAERALAAATAEVGAATADLYPKLSLTGAATLVSSSLSSLIASDSLQPSAGAALNLPLLDGGRRRATVQLRQAQADDAALAYRGTVLTALREVEDALTRLQADRERTEKLRAAEAAARDTLDTALVRRRAGLIPELEAIEARTALVAASGAVAQVEAQASQDLVALCKALGGGWDDRRIDTAEETPRG